MLSDVILCWRQLLVLEVLKSSIDKMLSDVYINGVIAMAKEVLKSSIDKMLSDLRLLELNTSFRSFKVLD